MAGESSVAEPAKTGRTTPTAPTQAPSSPRGATQRPAAAGTEQGAAPRPPPAGAGQGAAAAERKKKRRLRKMGDDKPCRGGALEFVEWTFTAPRAKCWFRAKAAGKPAASSAASPSPSPAVPRAEAGAPSATAPALGSETTGGPDVAPMVHDVARVPDQGATATTMVPESATTGAGAMTAGPSARRPLTWATLSPPPPTLRSSPKRRRKRS
ncbi:hypothetical protein E2562_036961 [Oryza meyeriana var. granulata]|uniref:Uncharacterized protein n=1 Tax=Oryza meyeriana var. granulata TaxID=110450 RepID=A0A6G1ETG0_9ORYZ|nr:hypothetical protein E2562_036961 [Oryza meyeriana var. granulata]